MVNEFKNVLELYDEKEDETESYFISSGNNKEFKYFLTLMQNEKYNRIHIGFKLNQNEKEIYDKLLNILEEYSEKIDFGIIIDEYIWFLLYENGFDHTTESNKLSYNNLIHKIENICLKLMEDLYNGK